MLTNAFAKFGLCAFAGDIQVLRTLKSSEIRERYKYLLGITMTDFMQS